MRRDFPGRVLVYDGGARHNRDAVHAVEFGSAPFPFLTVWTKGQVAPFRETDHDPATYHGGDAALSWVPEVYGGREACSLGYKQHFHVRLDAPARAGDLLPYMEFMSRELWQEALAALG